MAAHGLEQVELPTAFVSKSSNGIPPRVVRGLCRAVNHGIRVNLLDSASTAGRLRNVDIAANETGYLLLQPCAHPCRVTGPHREMPTQIVVEANHPVALPGEMHHGFAADESTACRSPGLSCCVLFGPS